MWQGSTVIAQCNHPDDYTALRALYLSTDGDNWTDNTGWPNRVQFLANPTPPFGMDMSGWYGITCDPVRIQGINLDENNLNGSIPSLNLPSLIRLDLSVNKLTGSIPNFNLPNLSNLRVVGNQLSGSIPNFNLPNLQTLELGFNQLSGSIPNFNLPNLQTLGLTFNQLSGLIPNFNLPSLKSLRLDFNQLSGLIPNFNLPNLKTLFLNNNQLSGSIINFNLPNLIYLFLSNNQLSGSIPNLNLINLQELVLAHNQFSGSIPIFNLPNLQSLQLSFNQLSGLIPNFNLPNLKYLYLNNNQLSGSVPNFNMINLNSLELSYNQLNGSIPNFSFANLQTLQLQYNQLNGSIPNFILPKLTFLILNNNQLNGSIPNFNLTNLQILRLQNNKLDGCIPSSLKKYCDSIYVADINDPATFINVKPEIKLDNNPLLPWQGDFNQFCATDGSLQVQIGAPCDNGNPADGTNDVIQNDCSCGLLPSCNHPDDYAALRALYLSTDGDNWTDNTGWPNKAQFLANPTPSDSTDLSGWFGINCFNNRVNLLSIASNNLNGVIPADIGKLSNLNYLYLNFNKLSGIIPPSLGEIKDLMALQLINNGLTGNIPPELGRLPKMFSMHLWNNQLTGSIPNELGNLENLYDLQLYNNKLTGCIPSSFKKYCDSINVTDPQHPGTFINVKPIIRLYNNPFLPWQGDFTQFCTSDGSQQAQIGAPCDNGNPVDGTNDMIQADCSCGTMPPCFHPDFAPLMALYDSTNGPGWTNKAGWEAGKAGMSCDPCNFNGAPWFGVRLCDEFGRVVSLQLSSNQLTGTIPKELGNLQKLQYLNLQINKINKAIPKELGNLSNLKLLSLSHNQLKGPIIKELGNLQYLQLLDLQYNQIIGEIPKEIGNLQKLNDLYLDLNQLSGLIPKELGNLVGLRTLALGRNQLIGEIPKELGNLVELRSLSLGKNQLIGSIPKELGNLNRLLTLSIDNNQLIGPIPSEIGNIKDLFFLVMHNNFLKGCFDPTLKMFCRDSVTVEEFPGIYRTYKMKIDVSNNPQLPWQGDFSKFCTTDGSLQAQIGASCDNGNPADGTNDVIDDQCNCVPCTTGFAAISGANEICEGSSTEFTATGGTSYLWSTGESTDKITVAAAGIYSVTVTDANGCTSSINKTLAVNNAPTATITGINAVCIGESTTFTATGGISYLWSNGAITPDITVNAAGTYSVTLTNVNGCVAKGERTLIINANPSVAITGVNEICEGNSTEFTATGGISYIWNTTATTDKIMVSTTGSYTVTVTDANGCTSAVTKTLAVNNVPSATITGTNAVCQGESTTFTAAGGISYLWTTGATTAYITVNTAGTYNLTVTNLQGCTSSSNKTLTVINKPMAEINGTSEICEGENTILTASGGAIYVWNTSATTSTINVGSPGLYVVSVSSDSGCVDTTSIVVTVLDVTMLSQVVNDTLYVNKGNIYQVDLLQNDILFTDSIKVQVDNIPEAFIRVLSNNQRGRINLEVKEVFNETLEIGYEVCDPCNPCVTGKLIILNDKLKEIIQTTIITPLESNNNKLQFSTEPVPDSELYIYNRWGQQIHYSKNYQNDWDASGYPGGVYYYVFKVYGFTIKRALTVVK